MLQSLLITNYAIINKLEIDFQAGLTTITGETGAGKSILLGALSLILGQRADISVLMDPNNKCIVEGIFDNHEHLTHKILQENEIDKDAQLFLRREISPNGKSRAFVNDTPVNLSVLKELGALLIDIHSQHENLNLNNKVYQLSVVDAFAGLISELKDYRFIWDAFVNNRSELQRLKELSHRNKSELEFTEFQFKELEEAKLIPGEEKELEEELLALSHAEEIKSCLFDIFQTLSGNEINIQSLLKEVEINFGRIHEYFPAGASLRERIQSTLIELKDIGDEVEERGEKVELDPRRLEYVKDRLDLIFRLEQKHKLGSVSELLDLKKAFDEKIFQLSTFDLRISELEKITKEQLKSVIDKAEKISKKREERFSEIQKKLTELLNQLGIPNARFIIENAKSAQPAGQGFDNISFLFNANKKSDLQEISKIASGGEISRLMLSIKYIISHSTGLPTIIFDEIDSGVSGEIAHRVARIMKEMSADHQVLAITHLPQVASAGDSHLLVYKYDFDGGSSTALRSLGPEERLSEIAKMLSGKQTTEAAKANAREMLEGS